MRRELLLRALAVLAAGTWLAGTAPHLLADEPVLLAKEAGGLLKITTERTLIVRGLEGTIEVETGPAGELRFLSTEPEERDKDVPVALWEEGTTLVLRPVEGEEHRTRRIAIGVPPGFAVRIEAKDSDLAAYGLTGSLEISGERVSVDAQSCRGPVTLGVDASVVRLSNPTDRTTVRGKEVDFRLSTGSGELKLYLTGKVAGIKDFQGQIEGDLAGVDFVIDTSEGPLNLRQRGGTAYVTGLRQGGTLDLSQTALRLFESQGDFTVRSDSDVQLKDTKSSLRLELYGGTLRASGNEGGLEATTDGTEVVMERLTGPMKLGAKGGSVRLSDVFGEVSLETVDAEINIDKASGRLTIGADGGDVTLQRVSADVELKSSGGSVRVLEQGGPARVVADGRELEVAWLSVPAGRDCLVQNNGGDVVVRFLGGSGGHVTAEAPSGRVESDLPQVVVDQGGTVAQGFVGPSRQPNVVIKASGNVHLTGTSGGEDER